MRKTLLAAVVAVVTMFGVSGAFTASADPGPNGHNDHGLCTAYFNGQKNGHSDQAGPFVALEETGNAYTDSDGVDNDHDGQVDEEGEHNDLSAAENIYNYCYNESVIGGNPDHGRFTCVAEGDNSSPECEDNPAPGNS